jgi:hypothetical protein
MATYYGYAERDANSYVDWGKLGQNLTETVQTAYKIREDKKAALDKAMQDNYAELANSPTGENQDINGAVTGFADNSKQYLLQVNKLLKAGVLKPKDYTLIMQNIQEDTKSLFDNAKNWQTAYGKILERNKNNTGSKAELDLASDVAAFGKFKNLNLMINPTTGRVSGAQMTTGPNGEQIKGDTKSMQQLNVLMNQPIDKYQLTEKLSGLVDKMGENQIALFRGARIQKNGEIREIEDKSLKASFDAYKNGAINEAMANPFNIMSILTDYQNVIPGTTDAYKVSTNPADKGKPNVIYYSDPDGDGSYTPEFSAAQRKVAEQYVTDQFLGLIDRKEKSQAIGEISQTNAASFGRLDQLGKTDMFGQQVGYLLSGTPEQKLAAASFFNGLKNADGTNVGGQTIKVDKSGKVTYIDDNGIIDKYNIAGLDKAQAGNQFYSMYAAPFNLDAKRYQQQVIKTGGKNVTIPKGDIESSKSKAAAPKTSTKDTSIY